MKIKEQYSNYVINMESLCKTYTDFLYEQNKRHERVRINLELDAFEEFLSKRIVLKDFYENQRTI